MELSIVIPVYKSEKTIGELIDKLHQTLLNISFEVVLVNDGSPDNSESVIFELARNYSNVHALSLSRNFGEHNAVMAGLNYAQGDFAVIIDDDFQHPPSEIIKLIEEAKKNGSDVVYGIYKEKMHSKFRNFGSWFNGVVANYLIQKPKDLYLSSFKCISKFVYQQISTFKTPYPYIDGIIFVITQNVSQVPVEHNSREEGQSNYTLIKLIRLWSNMVFNFSRLPLQLCFFLGTICIGFGLIYGIATVIEKISNPTLQVGWASLIGLMIIFSGVQLVTLGIIGEYIGRIFSTLNKAPQFIIKRDSHTKQ